MIFIVALGCIVALIIAVYCYALIRQKLTDRKKHTIRERDKHLRAYLKNISQENKLGIIDETPREVFVGNKFYMLQPLKYRQYTRLCIMLARSMQTLHDKGVDVTNIEANIGDIVENMEDDFFRAVAIVLFFSKERDVKDERKIFEGMEREYQHLVENASMDEISRVLEVILAQNDIDRALKAFGLLGGKKKPLMGT